MRQPTTVAGQILLERNIDTITAGAILAIEDEVRKQERICGRVSPWNTKCDLPKGHREAHSWGYK